MHAQLKNEKETCVALFTALSEKTSDASVNLEYRMQLDVPQKASNVAKSRGGEDVWRTRVSP